MSTLSVLIAVYGRDNPGLFRESLWSNVLGQTERPDQLVVVVDGPVTAAIEQVLDDARTAFTASLGSNFMTLVRLRRNKGLPAALNAGIAHCGGELIARADADDLSYPERFRLQKAALAEHPEVDVVTAWQHGYDTDQGRIVACNKCPERAKDIAALLQMRNPVCHPSMMIRAEVFRRHDQEDEVYEYLTLSVIAVALAYLVACVWIGRRAATPRPQTERDAALKGSARLIAYLTPVCGGLAVAFVAMRWGTEYGEGDSMPYIFQIFLYAHLYTFFFYLRFVDADEVKSRRFLLVSLAVLLPRLLIATHWGRFFVGQALLPFVFALLVGGNVKIRMRHLLMIIAGAGCIYFVLPLLRGDDVGGEGTESVLKFIAAGGPVNLVGQVEEVDQTFPNVNFLMTGLVGPFAPNLLSAEERIDIWGQEGAPLTLDRAFAALEGIGFYSLTGPGSVYVADLLVLGGMGALLGGSVVIGIFLAFARSLYRLLALFSLALFDIVSKIVFLPRTSFTYLIDRVAILTVICAFMLYCVRRAGAAK